jgi:hypothetical protein
MPRTHGQRFLLRRIEAEKPQRAGVAAVVHRHQQLAARAELTSHGHGGLDLHRVALAGIAQLGDAGFVLVTQRQVQRQVDVAVQAQLVQAFWVAAFEGRTFPGWLAAMGQCLCGMGQFCSTHHAPSCTPLLSDFDFTLPPELIAQHPAARAQRSRLLDGTAHARWTASFAICRNCCAPGDLLVFNDTKVVKARLFGEKPTGGKVELLIERVLSGRNQVAAHMRSARSRRWAPTVAGGRAGRGTTVYVPRCWAAGPMPTAPCSALC